MFPARWPSSRWSAIAWTAAAALSTGCGRTLVMEEPAIAFDEPAFVQDQYVALRSEPASAKKSPFAENEKVYYADFRVVLTPHGSGQVAILLEDVTVETIADPGRPARKELRLFEDYDLVRTDVVAEQAAAEEAATEEEPAETAEADTAAVGKGEPLYAKQLRKEQVQQQQAEKMQKFAPDYDKFIEPKEVEARTQTTVLVEATRDPVQSNVRLLLRPRVVEDAKQIVVSLQFETDGAPRWTDYRFRIEKNNDYLGIGAGLASILGFLLLTS